MGDGLQQNTAGSGRDEPSSYDFFIFFITILSLILVLLLAMPGIETVTKEIAFALDTLICFIFLGDFFHSLFSTTDKREYLKTGWIDLLGSIPAIPLLRVLRIARLIRIVRLMRRYSFRQLWEGIKQDRANSALWIATLGTILMLSTASLIIIQLELDSPETKFETSGDAIWWSLVTVTTVGYGDLVPSTPGGRAIAVGVMTVGVAMVSVLTSYITSVLFLRKDPEQEARLISMQHEFENLDQKLDEIMSMLSVEE